MRKILSDFTVLILLGITVFNVVSFIVENERSRVRLRSGSSRTSRTGRSRKDDANTPEDDLESDKEEW